MSSVRLRRGVAAAALVAAALLVLALRGGQAPRNPAALHARSAAAAHAAPVAVPILMYHVINPAPAGAPFPGLYVPPAEFAAQMHALAAGGLSRRDDGSDVALLARRCSAAGAPCRRQLRQRLPLAVLKRAAGAERARLARRREPAAERPATLAGGADPRRGARAAARRLGARYPGHQPRRPDHARPRRAARTGGHSARRADCALPRRRQLVLLPLRPLQRHRHSCGPRGRLPRVDDGRSGLGERRRGSYRLPRLRVLGGTSPASLLAEIRSIRGDAPPPAAYP